MTNGFSRTATVGEHAVVLGGSMGGLLAARVLSDFYTRVTVIERDVLGDTMEDRKGVPQGRHLHGLLMRGARAMDELFPGFLDELTADGASVWDGGDLSETYYCMDGHVAVGSGSAPGIRTYGITRPFIECHVRNRVRAIANVRILDGHEFIDLRMTSGRVIGARVMDKASAVESELKADLVVDSTGRGARMTKMLEPLGYESPSEDKVEVDLMYASQLLRLPPGSKRVKVAVNAPRAGRPRGLAMAAVEHGLLFFTVFGMAGDHPPADFAGMCDFVEGLLPVEFLEPIRSAEALRPGIQFRYPASRWRRYDKLRRFPEGLLVFGDAICSFNPIHGQGMTVAALEALALRDCLSSGTADLSRRFFRAAARPIKQAWGLSAGGDRQLPEIGNPPSVVMRLFHRYVDRVLTAAEHDAAAWVQMLKVAMLIDPAAKLLRPSMVRRAILANRRSSGRELTRPYDARPPERAARAS